MILVKPSQEHLPSYVSALKRGYSPSTHEDISRRELERIGSDPVRFIELQDDREAKGDPIQLPDGSAVSRLPGFVRWMWDGEFAGSISLRWQPDSPELPRWCMGHIGYSVVPWRRRRGYATEALGLMLHEARTIKLPYVEIVTDKENAISQRVIAANGGKFVEQFSKGARSGKTEQLRFRIDL